MRPFGNNESSKEGLTVAINEHVCCAGTTLQGLLMVIEVELPLTDSVTGILTLVLFFIV